MNTADNAAATQTETTTAAPSKMQRCGELYNEIFTRGYDLKGKSQRACFIERAQAEIGMTKAGAATYFQNLSNKNKGEDLYKYNNKKKPTTGEVKGKEEQTSTTTVQANAAADAEQTKGPAEKKPVQQDGERQAEPGVHRWMVMNAAEEEIDSFPTRAQAKSAAAEDNLQWADRLAK